jgi:hypothetical protein
LKCGLLTQDLLRHIFSHRTVSFWTIGFAFTLFYTNIRTTVAKKLTAVYS